MVSVKSTGCFFLVDFLLLAFLIILIQGEAYCQETRDFTVRAGESVTDVLSPKEIFLYPDFTKGKAVNRNGTSIEGLFNYNIINGEIQFIGSRKDTLAVSNPGLVSYFTIAADTFYFNKGYYRKLSGNKYFMLAAMQYTKLADVRKEGPYGTTTSTSAVDSYSTLISDNHAGIYKLRVNVETIFSMRCDYYFGNPEDGFVPAKKNSLLKMFPERENNIKQYLKNESIRFNNKDDLIKLMKFIVSL